MAHYTTIFGYVESFHQYLDRNQAVLDNFTFDEVYPFANGFGKFVGLGDTLIAAYATIVKYEDEETWLDWINRFEELNAQLDGHIAQFRFESDNNPVYVRGYSRLADEAEIWESWVLLREPFGRPAQAGVITYTEFEDEEPD